MRGRPGEQIARLTPLEWTCIGNSEVPFKRTQTNFTFFLSDIHALNNLVRRYWDIQKPKATLIVNPHGKFARHTVAKSLTFVDCDYVVACLEKVTDLYYLIITLWLCSAYRVLRENKRGPCNLVRLRKKYCRPTMINDTSVKFHMEKISLSKPSTCPIIQC